LRHVTCGKMMFHKMLTQVAIVVCQLPPSSAQNFWVGTWESIRRGQSPGNQREKGEVKLREPLGANLRSNEVPYDVMEGQRPVGADGY